MPSFTDALRGYAFPIHKRDKYKCVYCGLDGTQSFSNWLSLSWDHLLPKEHPLHDDSEYIATACMFCNVADNQYFVKASKRGITFKDKSRKELIAQRKPYVMKTRESYRELWESSVYRAFSA